jgi:hypothetical protein
MHREREKGAGKVKAVLVLFVLIALVYVGFKVVPPYMDNYQLQDAMKTEARFAGVERKNQDQIRADIFARIRELGIPAKPEDVVVEPDGYNFKISVKYTVLVDLPGYQLKLDFQPNADSRSI